MKTMLVTKFAGILFLSAAHVLAVDPDLPFQSGSTGLDGPLAFREIPGGRQNHAMAYDPLRQETVLFGGFAGGGYGDTWVLRSTGNSNNWVQLNPPGTVPLDRWGHRMVFDAARGEILMFGGTRGSGRMNDTWTWNGMIWTLKSPVNSPTPRDGHAMAYDGARQQVVLFGGNNNAGTGGDETWLWDGTDWTKANPGTKPQVTANSTMVYDANNQKVVLFGNYGQTWIWDGSNWSSPAIQVVPGARSNPGMAYDPSISQVVMFGGSAFAETWTWNGVIWSQKSPTVAPPGRQMHTLVYDSVRQRIVLFGGDSQGPSGDAYTADTWLWNGSNWAMLSDKVQIFDLSTNANGIFNFTTINVPPRVTVRFKKNTANTPVRWLATGDVTIDGTIDVSGQNGTANGSGLAISAGGPGGFDGGRGGLRIDASGLTAGQPGQGPGGGASGTVNQTSPTNLRDGAHGQYLGTYGNSFLQPLLGGSGGGGGISFDTVNGGSGGGGGGAIMISSSRDIILNGGIYALGGYFVYSGASYGGYGSGGAILLRADRVTGPGTLQAYGGTPGQAFGRIRVESYIRTLSGSQGPTAVVGLPATNNELNQVGTLIIASVKGINVPHPPGGSLLSPDVVFTDAGPVTVVVNGTGIPDGTQIKLRVTTGTSVVEATPQTMTDGAATFSVTVPKGVGTLLATAQFNKP